MRVGSPEGGAPKAWTRRCSQTSGECTNIGTSPYINNSLFISLLLFHFLKTKYFHRNVGTYKIGVALPHNILGFFCWGRSLKRHKEIRELFMKCEGLVQAVLDPSHFGRYSFQTHSFIYFLFFIKLFICYRKKKKLSLVFTWVKGLKIDLLKFLMHSLGLQASGWDLKFRRVYFQTLLLYEKNY